jgi:hypothetical protein
MNYQEQGFREATLNQLKTIVYLLDYRILSRDDLESIDRWIEGRTTFSPNYIIGWMDGNPIKPI